MKKNLTDTVLLEGNVTLDCNGRSITGSGWGPGVELAWANSNMTIKNCKISGFYYGLISWGGGVSNFEIDNNEIFNNDLGMALMGWGDGSSNHVISNNEVRNNVFSGISLWMMRDNVITGNSMSANGANLAMNGRFTAEFIQTSVTGNTLDGGDLVYIDGQIGGTIDYSTHPNAKAIFCANCNGVTIDGAAYPANRFSNNGNDLVLADSSNSIIKNFTTHKNLANGGNQWRVDSITSHGGSSNTIKSNTVNGALKTIALYLDSNDNVVEYNTFNLNPMPSEWTEPYDWAWYYDIGIQLGMYQWYYPNWGEEGSGIPGNPGPSNNVIQHNDFYGGAFVVSHDWGTNNSITDNNFDGGYNAVFAENSVDIQILRNDAANYKEGVFVINAGDGNFLLSNANALVADNHIHESCGIYFHRASYSTVRNNIIENGAGNCDPYAGLNETWIDLLDNGIAIAGGCGGWCPHRAEYLTITENTVRNMDGDGIYLHSAEVGGGANNNTVSKNVISQNGGAGIKLVGSTDNDFFLNDVYDNAETPVVSDTNAFIDFNGWDDKKGLGNYWGIDCPSGSFFVPGVQSNEAGVLDRKPFGYPVAELGYTPNKKDRPCMN